MAFLQYDESNQEVIDPNKFTPLPAGKYEAMIVESDSRPCNEAPMDQLVLVWQITSGEYEGRKIWDRINMRQDGIDMASVPENYRKAIEIGQKSLNTIFQALGTRAQDSAELHNIPCIVDVKIKPARKDPKTGVEYSAGNEIRNYMTHEAAEAAATAKSLPAAAKTPTPSASKAAGQTVATAARTAPAAPAKKPWERK